MPRILDKQIECIEMRTQAGANAAVSLHGAQLLSWKPLPCLEEQLYLSKVAIMDGQSAIRGGVPVIFPHFGTQSDSPNHGFARLMSWNLVSRFTKDDSDAVTLELSTSKETKAFWPHQFTLRLQITLFDSSIYLVYEVENAGENPLSFSGGLHTYLSTQDISQTRVSGLSNCTFIENGQRYEERHQLVEVCREIDRVYFTGDKAKQLVLITPERCIVIESSGFNQTVVWNPWIDGVQHIGDMQKGDYSKMLCVESVVATEKKCVWPGRSWRGSQWLKYKK